MNKKKYMEKRATLMNEAQQLIDAGEIDKANEKMGEVTALDESFQEQVTATAALQALNGTQPAVNMQNLTDAAAENALQTMGTEGTGNVVNMSGVGYLAEPEKIDYACDAYKTAWAKTMMGKSLTDEETDTFKMVNEAFSHTTENTGVVIPKSVETGIWKEVGELYPYWNDISKTYVKGFLSIVKGDTSTDAAWYEEEDETEDAKETFGELNLNGCELSRSVNVSWKLREMSMSDFLPYIQTRLAEKMGAGLGYGVTHGKGQPGTEDTFKPEPLGVITALKAQAATPQIIEYTAGALTYDNLTDIRAKIKSGYAAGLAVYANSETIWNEMAKVKDANGRPILMDNVTTADGVARILGCVVKEDDSMSDGEILFSNASRGYTANVNKEMSVTTEEHVKKRNTDYCGYAIVDGGVMSTKAHALLKRAAGE